VKKPKSDNRLSISDLSEIKELARTVPEKELALKYNVSYNDIREIVKGHAPISHFCIRKLEREITQPQRIQQLWG
jgi:hypothetical protein